MVKHYLPSDDELRVINDTTFLQIKFSVSKKAIAVLADIEQALKEEIHSKAYQLPKTAFQKTGKISKGENYRGLPYFILDFPRLFTSQNTFAFRTMIRWGHEFSCTLHIAGDSLTLLNDDALRRISSAPGLFFCVGPTPWEYHYLDSNYLLAETLSVADIKKHISENQFIKISRYTSINEWNEFYPFSLSNFNSFLNLIK